MGDIKIVRAKKHSKECPCNNGEKELLYFTGILKHRNAVGRGDGYYNFVVLSCNWDGNCPAQVLVRIEDIERLAEGR